MMSDRKIKRLRINQAKKSQNNGFSGRGRFIFQWLTMILLVVLLLPVAEASGSLTCRRLPVLMDRYLASHYSMKTMTGEIRVHAVEQMIKRLDPSKTLLYESDLDKLKPILHGVVAGMQEGECGRLQDVYDLIVARARENEAIVKKILRPGYRIDETVELNINADKRPYLRTPEEKKELLRKIVQFQIQNSVLAGISLSEAKKKQIHNYELQTMRVVEHNPDMLITSVAESFALALDPHTTYLSPENLEDFRIHMQLSLEGIGASLGSDNGFTIIEELIPGGGAERSGLLKPKDKIIAVAQEGEKPVDVIDMYLRDVVKLIRGKKGTKVTLTILRQEEEINRFGVTITRDKINMKEQEAKISYKEKTVKGRAYRFGVIDLPSFYGNEKEKKSCYEDVKKLLAEARKQGVDGIVLDLSRNGGGLLNDAVRMAGLFLGRGGIVATKDGGENVTIYANGSVASVNTGDKLKVITFPAEDPPDVYTGPLVVLTSRMSASASEIVAGALKDYRRALIVGSDHTFGKGSVQAMSTLPFDLGGMKVTTALYFLPGGKSTQKMGVEADVRLPFWYSLEEVGETELDYPLPVQEIIPFLGISGKDSPLWEPVEQLLITELAARSKMRVDKNEEFTEIVKNNKDSAAKKGVIRIADLRKKAEKENKGEDKKGETLAERKQKAREQYAPFVDESVNILLDMVTLGTVSSEPLTSRLKGDAAKGI